MPPPPKPQPPAARKGFNPTLPVTLGIIAASVIVLGGISYLSDRNPGSGDEDGANGCPQVATAWVEQYDMPSGTYVYADAGTASNGHASWVVKKDDGAVWATDVDPSTTPGGAAIIVPLNDQARQDSTAGVDLSDEVIAGLFPDASVDAVTDCG
jgi:hypothetical protein